LKGPTLAHVLERSGSNNFTALRLIAALVVVWFHQGLLSGSLKSEPISVFIYWEGSGHAAVDIFFLISGMLVSQSYARHAFPSSWVALRIARVWPGLIVVTILVNFVIAALNAEVSWWEFVTYPETRRCVYTNLKLVLGSCVAHTLAFPGVAAPTATNLPLWSLPVEVHCYIFLLVIGLLGAFRSKLVGTVLIVAGTTVFLFVKLFAPPMGSRAFQDDFVGQGGMTLVPPLFFFLGILLYTFRERIIVDWRFAIALVVAYVIARKTPLDAPLFYVSLVYCSLAVAASATLKRV
jgi:peptidoglycan/LPS O-acetylase OafA/YrhL